MVTENRGCIQKNKSNTGYWRRALECGSVGGQDLFHFLVQVQISGQRTKSTPHDEEPARRCGGV